MRKKGNTDVHSDDILEPQIHDINTHEVLIDDADDHLEKDLLADEISEDPEEDEDEFALGYAMDPNDEYSM